DHGLGGIVAGGEGLGLVGVGAEPPGEVQALQAADPRPRRIGVADGVGAVAGVDAPAQVGAVDPPAQAVELVGAQTPGGGDGGAADEVDDLAGGEAAGDEVDEAQQDIGGGIDQAGRAVGHGDVDARTRVRSGEDRLGQGGDGGGIRAHQGDVVDLEAG